MNIFSSETFTVLMHIASPNAFGNCAHLVINMYSNTHEMKHFSPILNVLIKKSNHQKIQEHALSEFLHQASYLFAGELLAAVYNYIPLVGIDHAHVQITTSTDWRWQGLWIY
jgi:hypothetical protein